MTAESNHPRPQLKAHQRAESGASRTKNHLRHAERKREQASCTEAPVSGHLTHTAL